MADSKRVAVIGAGPAGLVTLKTLLQDGHRATCYEMSPTIGGVWNYEAFKTDCGYQLVDDYDQPIQAVYKSLWQNTSKQISSFSDFPAGDEYNLFMSHWEYKDYVEKYAEHFQLMQHIHLDTKVTKLEKKGSSWILQALHKEKGKVEEVFDFVMVATGCFKFPYVPEIPGLKDRYKGLALHTAQVRELGA